MTARLESHPGRWHGPCPGQEPGPGHLPGIRPALASGVALSQALERTFDFAFRGPPWLPRVSHASLRGLGKRPPQGLAG